MAVLFELLRLAVLIYLLLVLGRLVIEWIQAFSRDWRPRGAMLVVAEGVFSATDPPIRALRKVIPPIRLGAVMLDLSVTVLLFGLYVLLRIL